MGTGVSPWADAWYFMDSGRIDVRASNSWTAATLERSISGLKKSTRSYDPLSDFGPDGLPGGVMQKVGDRAAWGTALFLTSGDGNATIDKPVKTGMSTIIPALRTKVFDTLTPLAETLYVAMQYFKQQNPEMTGFPSTATSPFNNVRDPYFDVTGTVQEACAQGFVLLLTDGMSTSDEQIPTYLKNYFGQGFESFPSNGTTYARDVAFYMNTQDLRSSTSGRTNCPAIRISACTSSTRSATTTPAPFSKTLPSSAALKKTARPRPTNMPAAMA